MTSTSIQNSSLTYMAIIVWVIDYGVKELKKGNL